MAKLDSIFADHESRLAPGIENPQAAVRDRILYRSAEREAGTRPQRLPGGSMDTVLPGELDVASPELSIGKLDATGEGGTTPAARTRDDIGDVGQIGNVGNIGDIGGVDELGKLGGIGELGSVDDIREGAGIGKIGDIGKVGDVGDVGSVDDVEEHRQPDKARTGDADGERGLRVDGEGVDRDDRARRRERRNLADLDLADLDLADLDSDSLTDALSTSDDDDDDDDLMGSALRLAGLSV
jgi:hypothetical protein